MKKLLFVFLVGLILIALALNGRLDAKLQKKENQAIIISITPTQALLDEKYYKNLEYFVKEANAKYIKRSNQVVWSVHIHKENDEMISKGIEGFTAEGATVSAQLRTKSGKIRLITGTVDDDGYIRWWLPQPTEKTSLYIKDIKGRLEWNDKNRKEWMEKEPLIYTPL